MSKGDADKWNKVYSKNEYGFFPPSQVLHRYQHLLPKSGKALDLACGHGRNAVHLSRLGLETYAFDVSEIALGKLDKYAKTEDLEIETKTCDLTQETLESDFYDVIVVSHFLDRNLIQDIKNALKENGLIFYQTFTQLKIDDIGPSNPDYLLARNELLSLFSDFYLLVYQEDADVGETREGFRNEAMIVAEKKTK